MIIYIICRDICVLHVLCICVYVLYDIDVDPLLCRILALIYVMIHTYIMADPLLKVQRKPMKSSPKGFPSRYLDP